MDNLALPLDEFIAKYVKPAALQLCDDVKNGRPLSELDRKMLMSCGYDPDELIAFYRHNKS